MCIHTYYIPPGYKKWWYNTLRGVPQNLWPPGGWMNSTRFQHPTRCQMSPFFRPRVEGWKLGRWLEDFSEMPLDRRFCNFVVCRSGMWSKNDGDGMASVRSKVPNHQLQEWHLDAEKITAGWNYIFERGRVGKKHQGRKVFNMNFLNTNLLCEIECSHMTSPQSSGFARKASTKIIPNLFVISYCLIFFLEDIEGCWLHPIIHTRSTLDGSEIWEWLKMRFGSICYVLTCRAKGNSREFVEPLISPDP